MKFEEKMQQLKNDLLLPFVINDPAFIEASRSLNFLTNMACTLRPPKNFDPNQSLQSPLLAAQTPTKLPVLEEEQAEETQSNKQEQIQEKLLKLPQKQIRNGDELSHISEIYDEFS